jgi:hypothetical protein
MALFIKTVHISKNKVLNKAILRSKTIWWILDNSISKKLLQVYNKIMDI